MPRAPKPVDACLGRATAIAATETALTNSRIVSLAGPGGVGKTRISLELAWSLTHQFSDGVWVVPLGNLDPSADSNSVTETVLSELGVADQSAKPAGEKLAEYLADREMLIVLDNCEHLLPSVVPVVRQMLNDAVGLRVLATSREPLGLTGEQVLTVPPLSVPSPTAGIDLNLLRESDAVRLLEARARAIDPSFTITDPDVDDVAELTARLDGLPLAIELCATRLRSLSVGQLLDRLGSRLDLRSREIDSPAARHGSLREVIDWSHDLCSPPHQVLWARLSVFPTSFDIAAAEDVCGFDGLDQEDVLEGVDRLVAQSILSTERSRGRVRYRMLSTIREYAMERLTASGEDAHLRRRHRDHYLARMTSELQGWARPTRLDALQEMDAERPHFAAALSWSAAEPPEHDAGLEFAATLRYHWLSGGHLAEGRRWLALFLDKEVSLPTRGHGLWVAAWVAMLQGDLEGARSYIESLEAIAPQVDVEAHVDHWTGLLEVFSGDAESAISRLDRAAIGHRDRGADALEMSARFMQAYALASTGRCAEAVDISADVVERTGKSGDHLNHAWAWWMSAYAHWKLGDFDASENALREVLLVEQGFRDRVCIAGSVALMAIVAESRGENPRARELARSAAGLFAAIGTSPESLGWDFAGSWAALTASVASHVSLTDRDVMSSPVGPTFDEELIVRELVEQLSRPRTSLSARASGLAVLTRREREVALLVAEGLTNREIAERLFIAPRTSDGHVERILSKLGVHRRSLVATIVVTDESWSAPHAQAEDV